MSKRIQVYLSKEELFNLVSAMKLVQDMREDIDYNLIERLEAELETFEE